MDVYGAVVASARLRSEGEGRAERALHRDSID